MAATLLPRLLKIPVFQIDTNSINGMQNDIYMNQLEKWNDDGVICINMSHIAVDEAKKVSYVPRLKKVGRQIYTIDENEELGATSTPEFYEEVKKALFPGGTKDQNEENDVLIVCDALKFNAHLITQDGGSKKQPGGILGNREKLRHRICILRPSEAVGYVKLKIKERDDFNQEFVNHYGGTLPPWSGKD